MNNKITPENIQELKENQIFVFGSNESGQHGAGAAKLALDKFGAIFSIGTGLMGNSYALPTKDNYIKPLSINKIKLYIDQLYATVYNFTNLEFFITEIGCGLAEYTPNDIAPLFKNFVNLSNCYLPQKFLDVINKPIKLKVYKMTDENMKCNDTQYKIGVFYKFNKKVLICNSGYHSCSTPQHCLNYYNNDGKNRLFLCEIEINGNESFENISTCGIVELDFNTNFWSDISKENSKLISFEYPKKNK